MSGTPHELTESVHYDRLIKPRKGLAALDFRELWRYRELFFFLAWRDILVRYKQTYLGVAWAVLQPVLTTVVFTIIFGKLAGLSKDIPDVPYSVLTLAAMVPWQFFSNAMTESSNSLVASSRMISKIYFPRLLVPGSAVAGGTIDFLIGLAILFVMMGWFKVKFTAYLLLLPLFFGMAVLTALAIGIWFSALNVKYRDVKYVVPFLNRLGMYVTPVGFTTTWLIEKLSHWMPALNTKQWMTFYYTVNPLAGVIDGFRWCILGPTFEPYWPGVLSSLTLVVVLLVSGMFYFRSTEKTFADVI